MVGLHSGAPGSRHAAGEPRYRRVLAVGDVLAASVSIVVGLSVIGGLAVTPVFLLVPFLLVGIARLEGLYDVAALAAATSTRRELRDLFNVAAMVTLIVWIGRHVLVVGAPGTQDLLAVWIVLFAGLAGVRVLARLFSRS